MTMPDARCWRIAVGIVLFAAAALLRADEPPPDSLDRDYSGDLPRIAALEPAAALAAFQLGDGYRLELVAAEPLVADPVAVAFDEDARMFVAEMRGYSENRDEHSSRIQRLVDADGDGRYEQSTTFVEGLAWPTALFAWKGGLIVADAPDILYFRDTDGDGVADERKTLFTGLGTSNVQGLLNSFQWGLDNRIYAAISVSGAELRPASKPDAAPLLLRGRDLAIEPRTMTAQAVSGGGQHGMSFNDWGDRFVCSNSDHLQMIMYDDRYLARNPYVAGPPPRRSIAADGPQAAVFRLSPAEAWRTIRTRLRAQKLYQGRVENSGRETGFFSSATGVTIYRGDAWPDADRGLAIIGDVGSNLVHRKRLEPDGIGYIGRRVDEHGELVASTDLWFRPVQFAGAPDGSLYILDMYREVIEHPHTIPPVLKKHLDLTSGRDRGRIYRLVPKDFSQPAPLKLSTASVAQLVQLLEHPNGWVRDTASRLLFERQDRSAVPILEQLAAQSSQPLARVHAIHCLAGLDALDDDVLLARLADEHSRVREHVVRLAEARSSASAAVAARLVSMTQDADLRVRYQLAFSLGELPSTTARNRALAELAARDASDDYVRTAILSSLGTGAGQVLRMLATADAASDSENREALIRPLAVQIGKQRRTEDIDESLAALAVLSKRDDRLLGELLTALAVRGGTPLAEQIDRVTGGKAEPLLRAIVADARAAAIDESVAVERRVAAVEQLRMARLAEQRALLAGLLTPAVPDDVQSAVLATLASYDDADVADVILASFPTLSPRLKSQAAETLLSRGPWTLALLQAIDNGRVAITDVDPARLHLLAKHDDTAIRALAASIERRHQLSSRADVIAAYQGVLAMPGDAAHGKQVFAKTCAACHRIEGVGNELGPNLAAMKARGSDAILMNVLDPNREVNPQYLSYILLTLDGRSFTGMIAAETANSVTLRRGESASDTILRIDIDALESTGQSLMPVGLEKQVDPQGMADLLEYLQSIQ